jgi:hypothetical protein
MTFKEPYKLYDLETSKYVQIDEMIGQTMRNIEKKVDELIFTSNEGTIFRFYHNQNCCEDVNIEDVCGDLNDLIGSIMIHAEWITNNNLPERYALSKTWTFYRFLTLKGCVTVRWIGESNGYYSEEVDFQIIKPEETI